MACFFVMHCELRGEYRVVHDTELMFFFQEEVWRKIGGRGVQYFGGLVLEMFCEVNFWGF